MRALDFELVANLNSSLKMRDIIKFEDAHIVLTMEI
jgi:hypothetical protein